MVDSLIAGGWDMRTFWSRVDLSNPDGCWLWLACTDVYGYGRVGIQRKVHLTHRLAYEILVGEIPEGLVIDHLCENKPCCNPYHMEPVTRGENRRRAPIAGMAAIHQAKATCSYGHEFTRSKRQRVCKTCHNQRNREYYLRIHS